MTLRPNIASNEQTNNQRQPPPDHWDWRTRGVLGPARNQGQLGSSEDIAAAGKNTPGPYPRGGGGPPPPPPLQKFL